MKITVILGNRLTTEHVSLWTQMQRTNPMLGSPYFRPEFVQAVASVRDDVYVGVLEEGHRTIGFFPFQRGWWKTGRPVGTPLSDFQGVVARPETRFNAEDLVRGCGLAAWRFDHLLAEQLPFRSYHQTAAPSPFLDLSRGFAAYREELCRAGSRQIPKTLRKARVAERRVGPLRFEFHTDDDRVFAALLRWKANQYRRTGHTNWFGFRWVTGLLELIRRRRDEAFAGVLSALYLGDRLAAVHLGMRSYGVLHRWFPAYDPTLGQYSPGRILLVELAKAAAAHGIGRIDRSKGLQQDKTSFMSGTIDVAEGTVTCRPLTRILHRTWHRARELTRVPVFGTPARLAARASRPLRRRLMFR